MKKVLIVSATDKIGGAEIVLNDFLENNIVHNFYLLTSNELNVKKFYSQNLEKNKIFGSENFKGYFFKGRPFKSLVKLFKAILEVKNLIQNLDIDILYGNNTKDLFIILFYKIIFNNNIKVISHIHDMLLSKIHKKFFKIFGNKIDLYITPSNACRNILINYGVNKNKIKCIYNGIKIPSGEKINKSKNKKEINIYIIGRICELKRIDIFINVVKELQKFNNICFRGFIIGAVEDKKYYENLKLSQYTFIKYLGEKSKKELMENIYPNIDALFSCSNSETLPTVVLEAMSFGKIVFARNVGGIPEIITNGKDGIIYDYLASPEEIAENIVNIFSNFELVNRLSKNAVIKIKSKFTQEYKVDKINELIGII